MCPCAAYLRAEQEDSSAMAKLKVKQVRSLIDRPDRQRRTMRALGLRKINQTVEHTDTPQIRGMIRKVAHLVSVEELDK
jgi:large subunit ribosomal protein L30